MVHLGKEIVMGIKDKKTIRGGGTGTSALNSIGIRVAFPGGLGATRLGSG